MAAPRHDFYQTQTAVIVSIYVKGCKAEDVQISINEDSLKVDFTSPSTANPLLIKPLFAPVDPKTSSFKVLGTKIEVQMMKADAGVQWNALQAEEGKSTESSTPIVSAPPSTTSSAAPRPRSKWDSFKPVDENGKAEEDPDIDDFFKQLYAGADDDTRKAMQKSYQESGGTSLSTNWSEVSKGKVETSPPDGMEARKY